MLASQLDELFAEFSEKLEKAYPTAGQWGVHPFRIIAMLLLQAMEGHSDRQAAEAMKLNVGWKLVLRLSMKEQGFDDSVLSKARDRFLETEVLAELFVALLDLANQKGYLSVIKQRVDATHIEACVRSLNRTELVLETVRNGIEALMDEDPDFVMDIKKDDWLKRYYLDRPFNYRLPKNETGRVKLAEAAGSDGFYILDSIAKLSKNRRKKLENLEAIVTLRRVLEEQFSKGGKGKPKFKEKKELRPSGERIVSPFEPDARSACKGDKHWTGYKAHLSETCVKGFPNLITHIETTPATMNDSEALPKIAATLIKRELQPQKLYTDSGYVNVDYLTELKIEHGIDVKARLANGHSWQSAEGKGFDQVNFRIDWKKQEAICPAKNKSIRWKPANNGASNAYFDARDCKSCPFKKSCAKGEFRILHLKPEPVYRHMQYMRKRQKTENFKKEYKVRAGAEGTQSEFVKYAGRQTKVRGMEKVHQKNVLAALAINFSRIFRWISKQSRSVTRIGSFEAAVQVA